RPAPASSGAPAARGTAGSGLMSAGGVLRSTEGGVRPPGGAGSALRRLVTGPPEGTPGGPCRPGEGGRLLPAQDGTGSAGQLAGNPGRARPSLGRAAAGALPP